jgi:hypothetical protein
MFLKNCESPFLLIMVGGDANHSVLLLFPDSSGPPTAIMAKSFLNIFSALFCKK